MVRNIYRILIVSLLCISLSGINFTADYYPADAWRTSTPEEQGVDSEEIYRMLNYITEQNINLHSIIMIRNGYLIHQTYFHPFHRDIPQNIYSCTKSFTSALVGMALHEGKIRDLDQKVSDFFPDSSVFQDPLKKELTVRHLLAMSTGLDWQEQGSSSREDTGQQLLYSKDWVDFTLTRPMMEQPGQKFNYCSGASHLLSAIITKSTGENTFDYAQTRLFKPLNIRAYWNQDPQGIPFGASNLKISSLDMAKFGYLYLQKGKWAGEQLIPTEWVEESTKKQIDESWHSVGYGYQWWVNWFGGYSAQGWGGQLIFVMPELNMVVVFTAGGLQIPEAFKLMEKFIFPAVTQNQPLRPNPKIIRHLKQLSHQFEYPKPNPVKSLPPRAKQILGKVFICEPNSYGIESFSLNFIKGTECHWKLIYRKKPLDLPVGLDGIYRFNPMNGIDKIGCRGRWIDNQAFMIDWQSMDSAERLQYQLDFADNQVNVLVKGAVWERNYRFTGKLAE